MTPISTDFGSSDDPLLILVNPGLDSLGRRVQQGPFCTQFRTARGGSNRLNTRRQRPCPKRSCQGFVLA